MTAPSPPPAKPPAKPAAAPAFGTLSRVTPKAVYGAAAKTAGAAAKAAGVPAKSVTGAPVKTVTRAPAPEPIRLNKRMAELGMCSRREADDWIDKGWVKVDGEVAEMGVKVLPNAKIEIDKKAEGQQATQVTIILNKPMGYVSGQAEDGHEPAVVLIRPENRWRDDNARYFFNPSQLRGLAPAGRLDIDSVGLLILTQDGRVARQLIGENSGMEKEYLVRVSHGPVAANSRASFPPAELARLRHGLSLDGQPLKPAKVEWENAEQLRFVLTEGKKRQIRRMCELVGLKVVGLKRIRIGRVMLGNLPTGQWRYLAPHERF